MIKFVKQVAVIAVVLLAIAQRPDAQSGTVSITTLGAAVVENFDILASTGTSAVMPTGWGFSESGTNANAIYTAGTGSSTTGDTYSFGLATSTDRAMGGLRSGSLVPIFGARFTNNTGSTVTSIAVSYTGEQWRLGATGRSDRIHVEIGVNATSLTSGTFTAVDALDFTSPSTTIVGALNGNLPANRTSISSTIAGLTIPSGASFVIRWTDIDVTGSDDGLSVDDFSITASGTPVDPAPTVTSTTPANGAANIAIISAIVINFSESVNATSSAFTLQCPSGTPKTFAPSVTPATSVTLTPSGGLPYGKTCTVTAVANQITDQDAIDPDDQMAANVVFSFSTVAPPIDPAPTVTTTTPANNALGVPVGSNVVINFSESVQASSSAFALSCGALQSFVLTGSPGGSLILNPDADLPYATSCSVTVTGSLVTDTDTNDPDDAMAGDYNFSFTTAEPPLAGTNVIINEIDADTPGSDTAEFVELFDGGAGNTPLDGLVIVFYTGADSNTPADDVDKSYAAFDLDGYTTNANGYFTLGNPLVAGVDLIFQPGQFGLLQNGADAVALYAGNASDFPFKTPVTTANLQDAIVYGTDDPNDAVLLTLLNPGQEQVNENAGGSGTAQSNQRCANATGGARNTSTYRQAMPTPDGENTTCTPDPVPGSSVIVISQVYGGGGNAGAPYRNDFVELYNRGAAIVDITGWSLQYASSTGSGWDFNKQPLAGTIAPGQYYLISLATGGANGAALPAANVTGGLINMAAGSGKIALVDNFTALTGTCPKFSTHLRDLVGYGTAANCREGAAPAPAGTSTTALLRKLNGATDTDQNGSDFETGAPNPNRRTAPIVELGPYVLSTDPRAEGTDAPRDATIQVTFTEPVDVVEPWFAISCSTTGAHDSFTQAGTGQSRYITPNVNFAEGEQCTVTILKDQVHDQDTADADPNSDTMTADHSWAFVVASGTAPPYAASVHLTMGNPTNAVADAGQPRNFLMAKPEFSLSYDSEFGRPNWVSWHLSSEWFGTLARVDTFRADPGLPADWYRVQSFDFGGSGFDRGHMVPNADRDKETSVPINQATFLMSNMIAQAPDNNQGPWAAFEGYLRDLAGTDQEIYIVAGGAGIGGTGSNGGVTATIANGRVTVPERTWKVALVLPKDSGDDISRVTCATRTIAINMPNTQGIRNTVVSGVSTPIPWETFLTTVDAVEDLTGYDLFSNLPLAIQACVEAGTNGNNPPLDTTLPAINCAAPDGTWHAGNVSLSCTASDTGSGLAHAGDASFTLTTSVVADIEDANASTGSRMVCDVAGNCVEAGPIAGNQIDRRAPVVTRVTPLTGTWHADNIAFAHTATDGGSGLASAGDASFSLVTSVVDDIEDANASTDARLVCDAVNNCAEAGPIAGIKIDRKDPVVSVITTADSAWHADNVALAHTASDDGSGLANAGDAAFSLVTSVANNVEDANASTNSRTVCDGVNNCVTAGPIAGNKIDRKAPAITLVTPPDGALYQLNRTITASYGCVDSGSGLASCAGTVANGAAIDTASAGAKTFVVNAADAAGNVSSATVSYTVVANSISISNIPDDALEDGSFVPAFAYGGDGATSVTSTTAKQCTVSGGVVNFHKKGTCTLVAHAAATPTFDAATGAPQSFEIVKDKPKKKDQ